LLDASPTRASWDVRHLSQVVQHWGTQRGIQGASAFLTNTHALADEMQQLYGRRADVVYLGGYGQVQTQAPNRPSSPLELLTVSRLQSSKRIDWILRALAALDASPTPPTWHLHVVGKGPEKEALQALALQLSLAHKVTFHGFVTDAELDALYQRSHVFLMPARQGYGLPAIEALYRHCAVVMNVESGVAEVLGDTPWVEIAQPGESAFAQAVVAMVGQRASTELVLSRFPKLPSMAEWAHQTVAHLDW
jgi:glycosyltransferase involved in cell wall biosynthesis